jgi:putative ABC transport system ATP-binding protein
MPPTPVEPQPANRLTAAAPIISVEGASKRYGEGRQAVAALSDVNLRVAAGERVAVMGPSGAGKSTLIHLIAGLDTPSAGRVLLAGRDLAVLSDDARSDLRLREIGFVFQSFQLFPSFTVEENVAWPLEFLGVRRPATRARARAMLARVGIEGGALGRRPAELAGGEQQRVAIARALVTEPRLVLADEPTGNLDSQSGEAVLDLLRRLSGERGLTVVLVTHSDLAASYTERIIELRDGRVVGERHGAAPTARLEPRR